MDNRLISSPFAPLLGTNYTPSDPEITQIQDILSNPTEELTTLDTEIADLEQLLQNRLTQRLFLNESFQKHKALANPLRSLPKSLLQQIFFHCLPHPLLPALDPRTHPLTLLLVCRQWRSVALDTPRLWQGLHLVPQGGSRPFVKSYMGAVGRWLKAARNEPVRISMCPTNVFPNQRDQPTVIDENLFNIFGDTILPHSTHIEYLKFDSVPVGLLRVFVATLPPASWPMLKGIILKWPERDPTPTFNIAGAPIWRGPVLERVEWMSVEANFLTTGLHWTNMAEIKVHQRPRARSGPCAKVSPEAARAIVKLAAPKLHTFQISLCKDDELLPLPPLGSHLEPPLVLPHLTALHLTDVFPPSNPGVSFLEGLQLPALQTLQYDLKTSEDGPPSPDGHPLVRLLRSQRNEPIGIKSFTVDVDALSRPGLLLCLELLPLLDRLEICDRQDSAPWPSTAGRDAKGVNPDKGLLEALLPSVQSREGSKLAAVPQCLCPRLTNLVIHSLKCDLEDVEAFVDGRLTFSKSLNATSTELAPVLQSIWMDITSTQVSQGPTQKKRMRFEEAIKAKGVSASFRYSAPSTEKLSWSFRTFDAYSGEYEKERRGTHEDGFEDGWPG